jgi:aquaporin Z
VAVLYAIASGSPEFNLAKGFAANGYGEHSPGKYSLFSGLLAEIFLTMMFLFIIMGSTHGKAPVGFAPLAIGLGLTVTNLVGIPITNASIKPARSTGPALFVGGWAIAQLCCSGWHL